MGFLRTTRLYLTLFIISYIPIILVNVEPFASLFKNMSPVQIISISMNVIIILLIFALGISLFISSLASIKSKKGNAASIIIQGILLPVLIVLFILLPFGEWSVDIFILYVNIPSVLSAAIGIIGTYCITCYTTARRDKIAELRSEYLAEEGEL